MSDKLEKEYLLPCPFCGWKMIDLCPTCRQPIIDVLREKMILQTSDQTVTIPKEIYEALWIIARAHGWTTIGEMEKDAKCAYEGSSL